MSTSVKKEIIIRVSENFVPEDGDAFAAVIAALDHFEIEADVFEREIARPPNVVIDMTPDEALAYEKNAYQAKTSEATAIPRIVIDLHGGVIRNVISELPLTYLVYDSDVEGCDDSEVMSMPCLETAAIAEVFSCTQKDACANPVKIEEVFRVLESSAEISS